MRKETTTHDGGNKAVHTVTTTYDSYNRINTVSQTDATTGTVTLTLSYRYDAAGNRREVSAVMTHRFLHRLGR